MHAHEPCTPCACSARELCPLYACSACEPCTPYACSAREPCTCHMHAQHVSHARHTHAQHMSHSRHLHAQYVSHARHIRTQRVSRARHMHHDICRSRGELACLHHLAAVDATHDAASASAEAVPAPCRWPSGELARRSSGFFTMRPNSVGGVRATPRSAAPWMVQPRRRLGAKQREACCEWAAR
jgi:hypothetical protein